LSSPKRERGKRKGKKYVRERKKRKYLSRTLGEKKSASKVKEKRLARLERKKKTAATRKRGCKRKKEKLPTRERKGVGPVSSVHIFGEKDGFQTKESEIQSPKGEKKKGTKGKSRGGGGKLHSATDGGEGFSKKKTKNHQGTNNLKEKKLGESQGTKANPPAENRRGVQTEGKKKMILI